jgi:pyrroline-5-carboxylate reductase
MPTTAAAIGQGVASIYAADAAARAAAHALFAPVGTVVDLADEDQMHAATAVSGSAPAYLYAFVEALEAAGLALNLPPEAARDLARATTAGAAALMADSGAEAADLRRQVTSPGGTTEAALKVLMGADGLGPLLERAASAAEERSRELGR